MFLWDILARGQAPIELGQAEVAPSDEREDVEDGKATAFTLWFWLHEGRFCYGSSNARELETLTGKITAEGRSWSW